MSVAFGRDRNVGPSVPSEETMTALETVSLIKASLSKPPK
jgi:hypothetical protein